MKQKLTTILMLTFLLATTIFLIPVAAVTDRDAGVIYMDTSFCQPGEEVTIPIAIFNNPGIVSLNLKLEFDEEYIRLKQVIDEGFLPNANLSERLSSPYLLSWEDYLSEVDYSLESGILAKLVFTVSETAPAGNYFIKVTCLRDGALNSELQNVDFTCYNGSIYIESSHNHFWGEWVKSDYTTHTRNCECGEFEYEEHRWDDGVITTPATKTSCGMKTYTCLVCGESKLERFGELNDQLGNPSLSTDFSFEVGDTSATIGETVSVPVTVTNNPGIASFGLSVDFLSDILKPITIRWGDAFTGGSWAKNLENMYLIWVNSQNSNKDGLAFTIDFEVIGEPGDTGEITLVFDEGSPTNDAYETVEVKVDPGTFTVRQPGTTIEEAKRTNTANGVKLLVKIASDASAGEEGLLIVAAYDGERLLQSQNKTIDLKNSSFELTLSNADADDSVKVFLLDPNTYKPLAEALTVPAQ